MNPVIMPPPTNDQASQLRELVSDRKDAERAEKITGMRSIAILSGKGGVGKSNVAVNLGLALAERGLRVAILDGDLGLANIDILFGVIPKYNIGHVLKGEKEFSDILLKVNERVSIIPGGAGLRELADLDDQRQSWVINRMSFLEEDTDVLLLDTSAGIHKNVLAFAMAADKSLLLTTPEPTAIRDAYSVLKSLYQATGGDIDISLLVNMTSDEKEAAVVAGRIISAAGQFLNFTVPYIGCVVWDSALRDSVKKRRPLLLDNTDSVSVPYFRELARKIVDAPEGAAQNVEETENASPRSSISAGHFGAFMKRLAKHLIKKETL